MASGKIYVPMPEAEFYKRTVSRDDIVNRFGEATVSKAEIAAIMNIMIISGMVKPQEFVDVVIRQCERIDDARRAHARLDSDRG